MRCPVYRLSRWMLIVSVALLAYCLVLLVILAIVLIPEQNRGPVIAVAVFMVVFFIRIRKAGR